MKKLEKIDRQEQKTREKIAALQSILKEIDGQRTEQENLQIVQKIRALKLSRNELYGFLGSGEMPPALAAAFSGAVNQPENIYSQNNRKRRNKRDNTPDISPDAGATGNEAADHENNPNDNGDTAKTTHFESEGN